MGESDWARQAVERRWDHYGPRFERFARGGWLSWNWAAFFFTLPWLRYRKLYAWSWAYFFFSMPVLLIVLMAPRDSCEQAIEPFAKSAAGIAIMATLALGWIVPPLVADRLYYNHLRARAGKPASGKGIGGYGGAIALQAFVGVLAVLAIPGYSSYRYRSMVTEGLNVAGAAKDGVKDYLDKRGHLPARIEEVVRGAPPRYVDRLVLEPNGAVHAIFGRGSERLSGHSVSFVPIMKDGRIAAWSCRSADLPERCMPPSCRM